MLSTLFQISVGNVANHKLYTSYIHLEVARSVSSKYLMRLWP